MNVEKQSGVVLSFLAEVILSADDNQLLAELLHAFDDTHRIHRRRLPQVDVEDFLRVPYQPVQIHRQDHLRYTNPDTNKPQAAPDDF